MTNGDNLFININFSLYIKKYKQFCNISKFGKKHCLSVLDF